jgi:hypothetical protein
VRVRHLNYKQVTRSREINPGVFERGQVTWSDLPIDHHPCGSGWEQVLDVLVVDDLVSAEKGPRLIKLS